jgi:hypothetical protein
VVQGAGPEFKTQYSKNKEINKIKNNKTTGNW